MTVWEAIQQRYSVRGYLDKPVEQEKLDRLMEGARLAPSAANRQEWRFIIVTDQAKRQQLIQAASGQGFVGEAPVVIVACAVGEPHEMACDQLSYPIDVAIALEHIALQATEEGLGTCWIGAFSEDQVKAVLGIPEDVRVVELMPLGYPSTTAGPKNRLPLDEIVMYESWTM